MAPLNFLMSSSHRTVESLVGEQVRAVVFVQDYVQFQFDGPGLTAFTNPIATTPDGQWRFPAPGARDALCASIARRVERVDCQDDAELRLDFGASVRFQAGTWSHSAGSRSWARCRAAPLGNPGSIQ